MYLEIPILGDKFSKLKLTSHCLCEFRRSGVEDGLVTGAAEVVGLPLIDGLHRGHWINRHGAHHAERTIIH